MLGVPVPGDDRLCRFVRHKDWSERERRPKPGAFKQKDLSVWDCDRLDDKKIPLDELRIEILAGHGQAHHTAQDYLDFVIEAENTENEGLDVQVVWRTEKEYVRPPWHKWRYAHVQVEATSGPEQFTPLYRGLLAARCRHSVPPDRLGP